MKLANSITVFLLFICTFTVTAQPFYRNHFDVYDTVCQNEPINYTYSPGHGALVLSHVNGSSTMPRGYLFTMKINSNGDTMWTKRNWLDSTFVYDDTIHFMPIGESVMRFPGSGNYLVASSGLMGIMLRQIDSTGNMVSSHFIRDTTGGHNYLFELKVLPCGSDSFYLAYQMDTGHLNIDTISGLPISRYTGDRAVIQKMTSAYTTLWTRTFDYEYTEPASGGVPVEENPWPIGFHSISLTREGGLAFQRQYDTSTVVLSDTGHTAVWRLARQYLHKLRPNGTTEWEVPLGTVLNIPATWGQMPQQVFATHDSGLVVTTMFWDSLFGIRYSLAKFNSGGSLNDSNSFSNYYTSPINGTELLSSKLLFTCNGVNEFQVYDSHLNFLYAVPVPFPENNFAPAIGYYHSSQWAGNIMPNEYGGAFFAFPAGHYATIPAWHSVVVNFDSAFNCYPSFVTGSIIQDNNHDCTLNTGDLKRHGATARLHEISTGTDYYGFANDTGFYTTNVPFGTYAVTLPTYGYHRHECGAYTYSITTPVTIPNTNFCDTLVPGINDLQLSLYSYCLIPGDTTSLFIYAYNGGTTTADTTIKVVLDPHTAFVSSIPAPSSVSGDTVTYHIHLLYDSSVNFSIRCSVSSSASAGDTLSFESYSGFPDNLVPSNDSATYRRIVTSSYDPNFIAVNQKLHFHRNNTMIYTVGFQNTGNARARNVVVLDTIDSHLDPASFRLLSSTGPLPEIKWLNGHRMLAVFSDVYLPDSATNPAGSHMEFSYSINVKSAALLGDAIHETAYIYFDYNAPIMTNTTTNIIAAPSVVNSVKSDFFALNDAIMYPNPTSGETRIILPDTRKWQVSISNLTGQILLDKQYLQKEVHLHCALADGIYVVRIISEDKQIQFTKKLVVTH